MRGHPELSWQPQGEMDRGWLPGLEDSGRPQGSDSGSFTAVPPLPRGWPWARDVPALSLHLITDTLGVILPRGRGLGDKMWRRSCARTTAGIGGAQSG